MEKYNLDDYNERLVKRTLNELLYVIDIDEIDLKKRKQLMIYFIHYFHQEEV